MLLLALIAATIAAAFGSNFAGEVVPFLLGGLFGLGLATLAMGNMVGGAVQKAMVVCAAVFLSVIAVGVVGIYLGSGLPGSLAEATRWEYWWGRLASGFAFALVTETHWRVPRRSPKRMCASSA